MRIFQGMVTEANTAFQQVPSSDFVCYFLSEGRVVAL